MHMKRKAATAVALGASAMLLAGCAASSGASETSTSTDADHVSIQLDFQPRGIHSIFYMADELGYFADEDIVVDEILVGKSSGETLRLLGSGSSDFGMADLPTLAVARSQEVPVKALAAVNQNSPLAMCTLADKHTLETPEDLIGLTVGVQSSGSTYVFYKALLAANGIDPSQLTEVTVQPPYENYLLTGQVDVVPCYLDAEVSVLEEHAGGEGSLSILEGGDWGYDTYGTGVFAADEMIEGDPELVERFMSAYVRAFEYVIENPEEAAQTLADSSPQLSGNVDLYTAQLEADIAVGFMSEDTEANGLGTMTEEKWQKLVDMLSEQGVIETAPKVADLHDSSFVDAANEN